MMDPQEIRQRLTSGDTSVLEQAISFVDARIALMRDRQRIAETRATAMLIVSGILAGFVVHFGKILQIGSTPASVLFSAIYLASIFLLVKSTYYAIKVLWVLRGNELNPELAFNLQTLSGNDALREELIWKIWEYYEILPLTNEKLFWLNRSQRNTVSAIISFMFLGTIMFVTVKLSVGLCWFLTVIVIIVLAFFVLLVDSTMEKFGGLWHRQ